MTLLKKRAKVKQDLQLCYLCVLIYIAWEVRDYFPSRNESMYLLGLVSSCFTATREELAGTHAIPDFSLLIKKRIP